MIQKSKWEDGAEATRAAAQMPASSVSRNPGGNNRQERNDAVSGQADGNHREDYRVGKQEHMRERQFVQLSATCGGKRQWCLGSEEPMIPSHAWQNDVKSSMDNTWQISPLCHMLLVRAFVLDGTNHDASVVTAEKVVITRQKGEGLDCLVWEIAKTWWHWCHDSVFKTKTHIIHMRRYVNHVYKDLSCPH